MRDSQTQSVAQAEMTHLGPILGGFQAIRRQHRFNANVIAVMHADRFLLPDAILQRFLYDL